MLQEVGLLDWTLTFATVFLLLSLYYALLSGACIIRMHHFSCICTVL